MCSSPQPGGAHSVLVVGGCYILQALPSCFTSALGFFLPCFVFLVLEETLLKELRIHIREDFPDIEGQALHGLIPVVPCVVLQCREDNWQYDSAVLFDQILDVAVVP